MANSLGTSPMWGGGRRRELVYAYGSCTCMQALNSAI